MGGCHSKKLSDAAVEEVCEQFKACCTADGPDTLDAVAKAVRATATGTQPTLNLHDSSMGSIPDAALVRLGKLKAGTGLKAVLLNNNQIARFPDTICKLSEVQTILAHGNQLGCGEGWVRDRTHLNAHLVPLSTVSVQVLVLACAHLRVSSHHCQGLPANFGRMSMLTTLDLADNQLVGLPDTIGLLKRLQLLLLHNNQLRQLPSSLGELTSLATLTLASNQLTELPASISGLTSLEQLSLSYNSIFTSSLNPLGMLPKLKKLAISNNSLPALPAPLCNIATLEDLDGHGVRVRGFPLPSR